MHSRIRAISFMGLGVFALALACGGAAEDETGGPSACLGGEFCPGTLVCVDGFCVAAGGETMSESGDGDGDGDGEGDGDGDDNGDGDGDPGDGDGDGDGDRSVVMVGSGGGHSCVLFDDGGVRCWGRNDAGQLGQGNIENLGDQPGEMPPPDVDVGGSVVDLGVGYTHTCVLLDTNEVRCWGNNFEGQLGLGSVEDIGDQPGEMPPSALVIDGTILDLIPGGNSNCVLLEGGDVRCWGEGDGIPDYGDEPGEVAPPLLDIGGPVEQLDMGAAHTCAIMQSGQVRCWGEGLTGAHGYGHNDVVTLPSADVALGARAATSIATGHQHTCAAFEDGSVRCWGSGFWGQLGIGTMSNVGDDPGEMPPAPADIGGEVLELHLTNETSCALLAGGVARCWGNNEYGQLGIPGGDPIGEVPGEMPPDDMQLGGVVTFGALSSSGEHFCVLTDAVDVRCWGNNEMGQLGRGDTEHVGDDPGEMPPAPVQVL